MSDPFYRTATWRRLRAEVLRMQPLCASPGCGRASLAVDHIVPRRDGGADALPNLRGLCHHCHGGRSRTAREPRAAGCHADGTPRDATHWWNDRKSLGAGAVDRLGGPSPVSSTKRRKT